MALKICLDSHLHNKLILVQSFLGALIVEVTTV